MKQQGTAITDTGYLPPSAFDMEEAVLGAVLIERDGYLEAAEIIKSADYFYHNKHVAIWQAMCDLHQANSPIDILSVAQQLKKNGAEFEQAAFYVAQLSNKVGSAAHVQHHAVAIQDCYIRRRLLADSQFAQRMALDDTADPYESVDLIASRTDEINDLLHGEELLSYQQISTKAGNDMLAAAEAPGHMVGITTGIASLDRQTLGLRKGHLIVLAARPAMGKTGMGIGMAKAQAQQGIPVGAFSIEMTAVELAQRNIAMDAGLSVNTIMKGSLSQEQKQRVADVAYEQGRLPLYVCDEGGIHINKLRAKAKIWKRKHNIQALYIDYLQKVTAYGIRNVGNREQEINYIASALKDLAKELDIPVIALAQLSRSVEQRGDKRPMLSDLRESGAIEQEADAVWFIYRPDYYALETFNDGTPAKGMAELIIAKFRGGQTGSVLMRFTDYLTKFSDPDDEPAKPPPAAQTFKSKLGYTDYTQSTREVNEDDLPF